MKKVSKSVGKIMIVILSFAIALFVLINTGVINYSDVFGDSKPGGIIISSISRIDNYSGNEVQLPNVCGSDCSDSKIKQSNLKANKYEIYRTYEYYDYVISNYENNTIEDVEENIFTFLINKFEEIVEWNVRGYDKEDIRNKYFEIVKIYDDYTKIKRAE